MNRTLPSHLSPFSSSPELLSEALQRETNITPPPSHRAVRVDPIYLPRLLARPRRRISSSSIHVHISKVSFMRCWIGSDRVDNANHDRENISDVQIFKGMKI
jgi:hypothetical protein